jgi:hypothetical protein
MNVRHLQALAVVLWMALLVPGVPSGAESTAEPDPAASLRSGIAEVVGDPARAAKMVAAVAEIEAATGELNRLVADESAALGALLRDRSSSRAEVDASLASFNSRREALALRVLTAHAALKAEATASEWKKLRKLETEAITSAASRSLGQAAPSGKEG